MKAWNFQIKGDPKDISKKLESSLGGTNRFVLTMHYDKRNLVKFKIRKRILLAFEIITQNNIIVNGNIINASTKNATDIEISFTLHPLSKLLLYGHFILGLGFFAAIILELSRNSYTLIVGGILLAVGIIFGLHLQKVFHRHVQEYRTLISEILER